MSGDLQTRVFNIIVEHLGVEKERVIPSADIIDGLGADSLDVVELCMAFEEEFGIEIPDEHYETVNTVQDILDLITKAVEGELKPPVKAVMAPKKAPEDELTASEEEEYVTSPASWGASDEILHSVALLP